MKVLIVGGGAVGSVIARVLSRERKVKKIICGTIDLSQSKPFFSFKNRKLRLKRLDAASQRAVARAAKDMDLIINASLPDFNLRVMEAALAAGADYLDLCSRLRNWRDAEQLSLHASFKSAGRVALINTGASPGITNLLAAQAADALDTIESVRFRILEEQVADRFVLTWSPKVMLDELKAWPLVVRDGARGFSRPFRHPETHDFGPGIGKKKVYAIYGDEISTLPKFISLRNADYKAGGGDIEAARALNDSGRLSSVLSKTPVASPDEVRKMVKEGRIKVARLVMTVEAEGRKDGRRTTVKYVAAFPDLKRHLALLPGANYISYPTGVAAAAFAKIIPSLREKGVYPPEVLEAKARRVVLTDLKRSGMRLHLTITRKR
jgi:saccharopine dehydrogenase-like NADP-dependent oxidoreductase